MSCEGASDIKQAEGHHVHIITTDTWSSSQTCRVQCTILHPAKSSSKLSIVQMETCRAMYKGLEREQAALN